MKKTSKLTQGLAAEEIACKYLIRQGLQLLNRNYRCKNGEIDLIMRDQNSLVFVEVRLRSRSDYGSGLESVTAHKQTKLIKTAQHYLLRHPEGNAMSCRFDVIGIQGQSSDLVWIKDAFQVE